MAKRRTDGGRGVPDAAWEQDRVDRERGRVRMLNESLEGGMEDWTLPLEQYELLRDCIIEAIEAAADEDGTASLRDVVDLTQQRLGAHPAFPGGRLRNYTTFTKVDLEARGILERVPKRSPQRLRLRTERPSS